MFQVRGFSLYVTYQHDDHTGVFCRGIGKRMLPILNAMLSKTVYKSKSNISYIGDIESCIGIPLYTTSQSLFLRITYKMNNLSLPGMEVQKTNKKKNKKTKTKTKQHKNKTRSSLNFDLSQILSQSYCSDW